MSSFIKNLKQGIDMTKGSPTKNIVLFMIPLLLGNIAQQLYNTVDSIIVGRYVGDNALAAVGSVGSLFNLLIVMFIAISVGASVIVSQYFGARDREGISNTVGACVILVGIATVFLMIVGPLVARPLLELLNTPESIIDWSTSYLVIMTLGVGGLAYYNILCGVMRGLGDSISPLIYLLITTFLNIALDLLFVAYFNMGVAGVALATVIAQFVSAILCLRKLRKMTSSFDFNRKYVKWNRLYIDKIVKLGLPSGLTQLVFSLAMVVIQPLSNSYGEMFIAANTIVMRVDSFAIMPIFSFGNAMTTYAGQNIGAGNMKRVEEGAIKGTILAVGTSIFITSMILLFGRNLVAIFTDTEELIDLSMTLLRILSLGYIAFSITQSLSGIMRGAGDTVSPMWISIFATVVLRVPIAYLFAHLTTTPELPNGNSLSVFSSTLISWVTGAILTAIVYKIGNWKNKAISK